MAYQPLCKQAKMRHYAKCLSRQKDFKATIPIDWLQAHYGNFASKDSRRQEREADWEIPTIRRAIVPVGVLL